MFAISCENAHTQLTCSVVIASNMGMRGIRHDTGTRGLHIVTGAFSRSHHPWLRMSYTPESSGKVRRVPSLPFMADHEYFNVRLRERRSVVDVHHSAADDAVGALTDGAVCT